MNSSTAHFEDIKLLEEKLKTAKIPQELLQKSASMIERLVRLASHQGYSQEYESVARYLDWVVLVPWYRTSEDIVSLENAQKILDENHYGLENIKERILEYIAVLNLKKETSRKQPADEVKAAKAPSLLLLGLVGTGKTTMAYSVAEALGRQFGRIPMGGMGDALQLRGRSRAYPDAEPGQLMKVLRRVGTKNPVILLDEIDRITDEARSDIMGVLVEILDPEQNSKFLDHYLDYPFDLSEVLFVATANNTSKIATAVLDRLEILEMPTYTDQQKIIIGKNYLLKKATLASGLSPADLVIDEGIWDQIVRPLGFDAGMRTLDRTINGICRKIAKLKVEGKATKVVINAQNLTDYIPKW